MDLSSPFFVKDRRSKSPSVCLSRTSVCSIVHFPSKKSKQLNTIRFSSPNIRSKFLNPVSASISRTLEPNSLKQTPKLAVTVVLPTPPLPEVTTIIRAIDFFLTFMQSVENLFYISIKQK